jgi:ribosomal protein S7
MVEHLDARASSEEKKHCGVPELPSERDRRLSELRRGWYWGSQAFCERMLAIVGKGIRKTAARAYKSSPEVKEHGERAAEQLLQQALSNMKTEEKSIKHRPRGDTRKLALAVILRKRTTVANQWIATRLNMGSAANVSERVRTADLARLSKTLSPSLRKMLRESI